MSLTISCTELAFCSCNKILTGSYKFSKLAIPRIYTLLFFISYCSIMDFTPALKIILDKQLQTIIYYCLQFPIFYDCVLDFEERN